MFYRSRVGVLGALIAFVVGWTSLSAPVLASPPIGFDGDQCVFPEPEDVICSGQHPGDATTATTLSPIFYNGFNNNVTRALSSRQNAGPVPLFGGRATDEAVAGSGFSRTEGRAAGDGGYDVSAWASYSVTETDNNFAATRFESSLDLVMLGADIAPMDNLIVGALFGYEVNDVDTTFNAGSQDITGYTIGGYAGYLLTDFLSIDIAGGFSNVDIDQRRLDSTNFTNIIQGDTDSDRLFGSANLNLFTTYGDLAITGRTGVVIGKEDIDAVVESGGPDAFTSLERTIEFGQVQFGGEVAWMGEMWEPYASAYYLHEFNRQDVLLNSAQSQPSNDAAAVQVGAGIRLLGNGRWSGSLDWTSEIGRDEIDTYTLSAMAKMQFD